MTPGHLLVVPARHVARLTELDAAERCEIGSALFAQLARTGELPEGWTVGVNDGSAAGQTIAHVHVHVIPRHSGDVPDPRGGLRMLFPSGRYWD